MANNETSNLDNKHFVSPMELGKHNFTCADDYRPAGYCHDASIGLDRRNWMSRLDNNLRMSDISLPGTHDTMSFYGGDAVQCQTVDLMTQLNSGIRVLDIRCRHIADIFAIHHGAVFQNAFFGDVLNIITQFLNENPSETIYMLIQKAEHVDDEQVTRSFEDTFRIAYWEPRPNLFWKPENSENRNNPKLSETRGKIVVLQKFDADQTYGIRWEDYYFAIQNEWKLSTNWDLYDKWMKVKEHLSNANNSDPSNRRTFVNYLSAGTGSFPYFVASGQSSPQTNAPRLLTGLTTPGWKDKWPDFPRVGCFLGICSIAFEGTNILSAERIGKGKDYSRYVGMILSDFPGKDLIDNVININF